MKKSVLLFLLGVFSFIIVHDFVIMTMDGDTQTELVLHESGQLQIEAMCDASKLHNHLHESMIVHDIGLCALLPDKDLKAAVIASTTQIIPRDISSKLYRPPIS